LFANPNAEVRQLTERELESKDVNVVLRITNTKGGGAWGRLAWKMDSSAWNIVDVDYYLYQGTHENMPISLFQ
jgi:hypothetical protein